MNRFSRISSFLALVTLAACSNTPSEKITALQKKDKNLSCREVLLEQNEAEFYRKTAEKNKEVNMRSIVMPLGYISTYMSAEEAIDASDARNQYLTRIYEIMDCENRLSQSRVAGRNTLDQMKGEGISSDPVAYVPGPGSYNGYAPVAYPVQRYAMPVAQAPMAASVAMVPATQQTVPQGYLQPQFYNAQAQGPTLY